MDSFLDFWCGKRIYLVLKKGREKKRKCKKALKGICEPNVWNMQSKSIIHTETAILSLL